MVANAYEASVATKSVPTMADPVTIALFFINVGIETTYCANRSNA